MERKLSVGTRILITTSLMFGSVGCARLVSNEEIQVDATSTRNALVTEPPIPFPSRTPTRILRSTRTATRTPRRTPLPTFTPPLTPSPTLADTPTSILTPTPFLTNTLEAAVTPVEKVDLVNQSILERVQGGEQITLKTPRITSLWQIPWVADEDEPKVATFALIWGEKKPAGVITSAGCLRDFYEDSDALDDLAFSIPLTTVRVWRLPQDVRVDQINLGIANVTGIADAESVIISNPEEADTVVRCDETKELERLQDFLSGVDWSELPQDVGEWTGDMMGDFIRGFLEGIKE